MNRKLVTIKFESNLEALDLTLEEELAYIKGVIEEDANVVLSVEVAEIK